MENEIRSDDGHAFKLLLSCPSGLSPSQVSVEFDQLDMIPYQASDLRNSISEIWDRRVQQSSSFYNGLKFRDFCGHKLRSYMGKICSSI